MIVQSPMTAAMNALKMSNNGRMLETAMTAIEKRGAEQLLTRGAIKSYNIKMPILGYVKTYSIF